MWPERTYNELLRVEYRLNMNLINMSRLEDWPITNLYRKQAWVRPNTTGTDPASSAHHYPQPTKSLSMTPFSLFSNPIRFLERDDAVGHYKRTRDGASPSFSSVWNKLQTGEHSTYNQWWGPFRGGHQRSCIPRALDFMRNREQVRYIYLLYLLSEIFRA